ncbi:MAG: ETC complex I subunit [Geminicoccaceae bacterium]|nr:ETC complex I subunit [Geminicoccaceae bacterium]
MATARIYQPAKTQASSGRRKTRQWLVEFEPTARKQADRLIGWIGSDDTQQQVQLHFPSKEAAMAYCKREQIEFHVDDPHRRVVRPKAYADNFTRRA